MRAVIAGVLARGEAFPFALVHGAWPAVFLLRPRAARSAATSGHWFRIIHPPAAAASGHSSPPSLRESNLAACFSGGRLPVSDPFERNLRECGMEEGTRAKRHRTTEHRKHSSSISRRPTAAACGAVPGTVCRCFRCWLYALVGPNSELAGWHFECVAMLSSTSCQVGKLLYSSERRTKTPQLFSFALCESNCFPMQLPDRYAIHTKGR